MIGMLMEEMIDYIMKYPEMIRDSINVTRASKLPIYDFDRILVCGMGGSAIGGDMLSDVLNGFGIQVEVSRRYDLPKYVDKDTIVFVVSYSGNTEETLSQFVESKKLGLNIIAISSDGRLCKWCNELDIPFVQLPVGFQPRAALPYLFFPMLEYVQSAKNLEVSGDIKETLEVLENLRMDREKLNEIRRIASICKDSRINVYGPEHLESAIKRLKCQINENSKLPSSWAVFPELNHNEIVGYEDNLKNNDDYVILLRDTEESPAIRTRIDATKDIIQDRSKGIIQIYSEGKSDICKVISLSFLGDILSFYLAKEEGKSPLKAENIDKLKSILRNELNVQEKLEKELKES